MKLRTIATAVVTITLLSTGAAAASAAPVPAPAPSADCQFGEHLLHVWLRLPTDLRGDLKGLRELDPADRGSAAKGIRDGAVGGDYGPGVEAAALHVRNHRLAVIERLPQTLKSDLVDLRSADQPDRRKLAREIAQTALDGGYGVKTQEVAERIQSSDAWQECVAS